MRGAGMTTASSAAADVAHGCQAATAMIAATRVIGTRCRSLLLIVRFHVQVFGNVVLIAGPGKMLRGNVMRAGGRSIAHRDRRLHSCYVRRSVALGSRAMMQWSPFAARLRCLAVIVAGLACCDAAAAKEISCKKSGIAFDRAAYSAEYELFCKKETVDEDSFDQL